MFSGLPRFPSYPRFWNILKLKQLNRAFGNKSYVTRREVILLAQLCCENNDTDNTKNTDLQAHIPIIIYPCLYFSDIILITV